MIETLGTRYPQIPPERRCTFFRDITDAANRTHAERMGMPYTPLPQPEGESEQVLRAFINAGRWMVNCPCNSAQISDPAAPWFFCKECFNDWANRKAVPVEYPDPVFRAALERELAKAPSRMHRNWEPGWTMDDVKSGSFIIGGPKALRRAE